MICTSATSYRRKKWVLADSPARDDPVVERFAHELRVPPILARLLMHRGITDARTAAAFLEPRFRDLHSPALLHNIDPAAARIANAARSGEKITLYGDYDVDGITGTAMLWHTLRAAGANVEYYIPHRVEEGYGLNTEAVENLANAGTKLLVTVDCGCSAVEPIARAKARGIDTVVSDHHEFGPVLPPALAIVHPRIPAASAPGANPPYPNPDLCGAGVAFKLAWAVAQKLCNAERVNETYRGLLVEFAALAALGTVADVVPLTGENRIIVKYGLGQLARTQFEGLQALIHAAGYGNGEKKLDCVAVGFALAPRLNAAGRMGHAREAVELLTTATGPRAQEIAGWLEGQNRQRQTAERKMVEIAREQIESRRSSGGDLDIVLVAAHESFHAGVVGIVASRLVDVYHRPAFVLAQNPAEFHGSARSISGFELHLAIEHVRDLLTSGGGHAMAGGVRLPLDRLEAFRQRVNSYALERLTPEQLTPAMPVDAVLEPADCHPQVIAMLEKLEPFGRGNPRPRFLIRNVRLTAPPRRVGPTGAHLQLTVSRAEPALVAHRCIAFKMGDLEPQLPVGTDLNLIVESRVEVWEGRSRIDLQVIDIARCDDEPFSVGQLRAGMEGVREKPISSAPASAAASAHTGPPAG
jgi:single-stranded-DNA-specific exonuclease